MNSPMRSRISASLRGSSSIRTASRPRRVATWPVVPLPAKGSKVTPARKLAWPQSVQPRVVMVGDWIAPQLNGVVTLRATVSHGLPRFAALIAVCCVPT